MNESDVKYYADFLDHETFDARAFTPDQSELDKKISKVSRVTKKGLISFCKKNNERANVYSAVLPKKGGRSLDNVTQVDKVWIEIDCEKEDDGAAKKEYVEDAKELANQIIQDHKEWGHPLLVMSGNGYHLIWKTDAIELDEENRDEMNSRIKKFCHYFKEKYEKDGPLEIDTAVGDLARILKIPGTMSVKGSRDKWRMSHIAKKDEQNSDQRKEVTDFLMSLDIEEKKEPDVSNTEKEGDINRLDFVLEKDDKFRKLYLGDDSGYESRSEAEMALACKSIYYSLDPAKILEEARIGKWQEASKKYRQVTIEKAEEKVTDSFDWQNLEENWQKEDELEAIPRATRSEPEFENKLPKDHFISRLIEINSEMTDAYPEYHFGAGLSLLSLVTQRKAQAWITPKPEFLNTWILMLGKSSVSRKTTAINLSKIILEYAQLSGILHSQEFSKEQFFTMLSKNPRRGYWNDEFGDFLATAKKQYQSGMSGFMCRMYDNPSHYSRELRKEEFTINDAFLPMLTATQPNTFARNTDASDIESGLFPRFLCIFPSRWKERKPIDDPGEEIEEARKRLAKWTKHLYNFFVKRDDPVKFRFEQKALDIHEQWASKVEKYIHNDTPNSEMLSIFFGRLQIYAFKLAALFSIGSREFRDYYLDTNNGHTSHNTHVSHTSHTSHTSQMGNIKGVNSVKGVKCVKRPPQMKQGSSTPVSDGEVIVTQHMMSLSLYYINNLFLPHALRVMRYIEGYTDENKIEKVFDKLVDMGGKAKRSELLRYTHMSARDMDECITTLRQANRLRIETEEQEKRGRNYKTNYYVALDPEDDLKLPDMEVPVFNDVSKDMFWNGEKVDIEDESDKLPAKELLNTIRDLDQGSGASKQEVILKLCDDYRVDKIKERMNSLMAEGTCFEPKPEHIKIT